MRIRLENVSFSYGGPEVLRGVTTELAEGAFTCLLGLNGSGKTTLLGLMTGHLEPSRGTVVVSGAGGAASSPGAAHRHFALLPQGTQDPPYVTVRELVALGRFRPSNGPGWRESGNDRAVVDACLLRCQVDHLEDRPFGTLSGGEKQRAWLAFCLAQEKDLLALDESLHGIDYFARNTFFRLLSEVASEGRGVLLTTHDLEAAGRYAHRVLVLRDGVIVHDGPPDERLHDLLVPS